MSRFFALFICLVTLCASTESSFAQTDFFRANIVGSTALETRFDAIAIGNYHFASNALNTKLTQTRFFVYKTKQETLSRLTDGTISTYTAEDIATSLEYLTHSMNTYFTNMWAFECTSKAIYQKLATQNLDDAAMFYDQLKAITQNSLL